MSVLCGEGLLERLAELWPRDTPTDRELGRALTVLGVGVDGVTLQRAARVVAVGVVGVAVILAAATAAVVGLRWGVVTGATVGALGAAVPIAATRGPRFLARLERTRALGAVAALIGRAAMRLRVDPAIERSAAFAARTGRGRLARSLAVHVRRATGTPESGFEGFAAEWGDRFPTLHRSVSSLQAGATGPAADRDRHLDRAVSAALDGVRDELDAFASEIRGPVTALYAFGVLLPLALVGVLPAARATGARIPLPTVVALYDVALPAVVIWAGSWLLARRPVAFPPPRVGGDHPDTPNGPTRALLAGVAAGATSGVAASRLVAPWAAPVAAVGLGSGTALVVNYRAATRVRERVLAVESRLHDALYLVGRRVAAGDAVEVAIADAADRIEGATGDLLADAARRQRRLGLTVDDAFRGDHGPLDGIPSRRTESVAALFALAGTEGGPAGSALVATANHLETLDRVEREARRELARVTDTLVNTAAVFGPLVGGATVALSARVARTETGTGFGAGALPTGALGVAVGAYVLWLAAALTVLSTGLTRGLDRSLVGYRVGGALCLATVAYLASYVGAGLFL